MELTDLKKEVIKKIDLLLDEKIFTLVSTIKLTQEASNNNTKSTAGDKHDTERAMAQLEIEKLQKQLNITLLEKENFKKSILYVNKSGNIMPGSLVKLNNTLIFIACALGKISVNVNDVFVISIEAPIAKVLIGKHLNDSVELNNKSSTISAIV
jgi:hypothetical protein